MFKNIIQVYKLPAVFWSHYFYWAVICWWRHEGRTLRGRGGTNTQHAVVCRCPPVLSHLTAGLPEVPQLHTSINTQIFEFMHTENCCDGSIRTHTHRGFTTLTPKPLMDGQQVVNSWSWCHSCGLDVLLCRKCVSDLPGTAIPHPEIDYAQHTQ